MKKETITAAAVLCALGTGFLACALHTDQPLSLGERRPLAQRPEVSVQTLSNGSFMSDFETYALDQFPLREAMRQLKAQVQYYLLRRKDNNGVYRGGFERKQRAGGSREAQSPAGNVSGGQPGVLQCGAR